MALYQTWQPLAICIVCTVDSSSTGLKTHNVLLDSVRREVLYNILIEFGVPMKLVRLIRMCLNEMCSKVHMGKHLSDNFPIQK
jgi:hypothetical protein